MAQAGEKVLPVLVVIYDPALFNPPEDHVVEGSWSIESRLAGHRISFGVEDSEMIILISQLFNLVNNVPI
jgi:hypothetical protein